MAIKYYQSSQNLFSPSTAGYQAEAQAWQSLASKLDNFSNTFFDVAAKDAAEQGKNKAIKDIASGDPIKLEEGFSYFNEAYNTSAKAAFSARTEDDLKNSADSIAKTSKTAEEFKGRFEAYQKEYLQKVDDPVLSSLFKTAANSYMQKGINAVAVEQYKTTRAANIKGINSGIEQLINESSSLGFLDSEGAQFFTNIGKINAFYDRLVAEGELSVEGAEVAKIQAANKAAAQRYVNNASMASDTIVKLDYVQMIKGMSISAEEKTKYIKQIYDFGSAQFNLEVQNIKQNQDFIDANTKTATNEVEALILQGDIEGASTKLKEHINSGFMDLKSGTELQNTIAGLETGRPLVSSPGALLEYARQGDSVNLKALISDKRLTYQDAIKIANGVSTLKAATAKLGNIDQFKMSYGQNPHTVASKKIKDAFPDDPKISAKFQQQIADKISKGELDAFGVVEYADQLIADQQAKTKTERIEKQKKDKEQKAQEKYKAYQNSLKYSFDVKFGTPKTLQDFMEE